MRVISAVFLVAFLVAVSVEARLVVLSGERPPVSQMPSSDIMFTEREYRFKNDDLAPWLSQLCRCQLVRIQGAYAYELGTEELGRPGRPITFTGPLGVLGSGRVVADGNALTFQNGKIVLAIGSNGRDTLWDVSIDHLRSRGKTLTPDAADLLWESVATDNQAITLEVATRRNRVNMVDVTRAVLDDAISIARESGSSQVDANALRAAIQRRCLIPIYPFCRPKLR